MDLITDIQMLMEELTISIKKLRQTGNALAEAEREYKITLRQEALKLRLEKDMPVSLINQIIFGVPEVADKRFKRDVAETMYNTNQEHINATKLKLRLLESQLQREWGNVTNER
ncbi:MAG: hypothetical protein IJA94_06655 [Bacilli bacterium]|nr:hypothetical protein [Bacilli bacterium]MBQ3415292.1 hypothetical protein [Clostridia bacterium]MBQ6631552.1 hypothetical protein [Romboutsia sp.]MBR0058196.1 hypothetical protein [Methanobrevibacter sp.]MBQ4584551.1 hypothetical protein [Bacilli bacterium]